MKPTSHLTRAVFRAIIANRPYPVAGCRRCIHQARSSRTTRSFIPYTQKRGLFGALLGATTRGFEGAKPTGKNLELALAKLVDLVRARRTKSRPPSDDEILDAFKFIFSARLEVQRRLTRNEIYLTTEAFKHIQEEELIRDDSPTPSLTKNDLDMILSTLALPSDTEKFRTDTSALASLVFNALPASPLETGMANGTNRASELTLPVYATVLARTGSAMEAIQMLSNSKQEPSKQDIVAWIEVLKGLANEGRVKEFDVAVERMHEQLRMLDIAAYEAIISFFAARDNFSEAERIYQAQITYGSEPTTLELRTMCELCARVGELSCGEAYAEELEARLGEEGVLGTLFIWKAARYNNSDQLKADLSRLLHDAPLGEISMEPFNHLFDIGLQQNKAEIGTVALELADAFDLRPNGKTYTIQLRHELNRNNLPAASEVFDQLSREDIPSDDCDLPVLNQLVAALAFAPTLDYPLLMRVVDTLLERNADFKAEALAGMCRVFLQRDELEDATGLLRHRADFYPTADRARISAVFQKFIMDKSVGDHRAYNAYELFRHAFPETSVEQRLPIMQSFFDRNRSDLACLVFGHMRQREDIEARPTARAYAQCFAGIAQCRDIDGLQMVFNMLKLDLEVEPTTRIRNGLMLAYIACQMPFTAMIDHFWKIMDSREGPTYSTFEVALRACETWVPQGGYEARKIMAIMQAWNLEITKELYDCYVGALAGQSEFENTIELIEEMEYDVGEPPDVHTIGAFYNAIPWQYRKDEVENWAKQAYPDLWEDLVACGDEIDEEWEIRTFKIDRTLDIDDEPLFASGQYDPQISRQAVQALEPPTD